MSESRLLELYRGRVLPEWIDYNGHMNVAYYVLAFDHATDRLLDHIGLDAATRDRGQGSVFTLELHVSYLRELMEGMPIRATTRLLDADAKRIHYFQSLYHAEEGYLAATCEQILLYMDMNTRRSAAMPAEILAGLEVMLQEHRQLPRPEQAGRVIGIRRR